MVTGNATAAFDLAMDLSSLRMGCAANGPAQLRNETHLCARAAAALEGGSTNVEGLFQLPGLLAVQYTEPVCVANVGSEPFPFSVLFVVAAAMSLKEVASESDGSVPHTCVAVHKCSA
jgi:hypothetical protein